MINEVTMQRTQQCVDTNHYRGWGNFCKISQVSLWSNTSSTHSLRNPQMARRFSQIQNPSSTACRNTLKPSSVSAELCWKALSAATSSSKSQLILLEETTIAIVWLKGRKAAGIDGTPSVIWKKGVLSYMKTTRSLRMLGTG